jgi:anionic cell wall polymer biosynthesis LytR-Cps2A-Psr (LCP) family protein
MQEHSQNKQKKIKKANFFKRHSGLKFFLISFGSCIVVFGIAATIFVFSIYPATSKNNSSSENLSNSIVPSSSAVSDKDTFNILMVTVDDSVNMPVQIAILRLDEANNRMDIAIIPLELLAATDSTTSISDVFATQGLPALSTTITQITHIAMNYTSVIKTSDLSSIIKKTNSINFNVPYDISCTNSDSSITTVKKGNQSLTGDQVRAIISSTSYSGGNMARYKVQGDLIKEFVKEKLSGNNLENANSIFKDVFPLIQTNFQFNDFIAKVPTFKKISSQNTDYINIISPDIIPTINGNLIFFKFGANASDLFFRYFNAK